MNIVFTVMNPNGTLNNVEASTQDNADQYERMLLERNATYHRHPIRDYAITEYKDDEA